MPRLVMGNLLLPDFEPIWPKFESSAPVWTVMDVESAFGLEKPVGKGVQRKMYDEAEWGIMEHGRGNEKQ